MAAAASPEPGSCSACVRSGKRLLAAAAEWDWSNEAHLKPGQTCDRRRVTAAPPRAGVRTHPAQAGLIQSHRAQPRANRISRSCASPQPVLPGAPHGHRAGQSCSQARAPRPAPRRSPRRPGLTCSGRAPAEPPSRTGGKSRSPRPPPPPQVSSARRGPGRPGGAPASPFSSAAFDPRALRRTSAQEPPGSARGDPGNGPRFISFHQAALGSLETAEPVIAFFRRPCADWITANQRLVYTW